MGTPDTGVTSSLEDTAGGDDVSGLSPLQRRTLDALRRSGTPVVFDPAFVAELRGEMLAAIEGFRERIGTGKLHINKHRLSSALGCEAHHLAPAAFEWTTTIARGQVAHRAIQLLCSWRGRPTPSDAVDEALARLADEDRSIGAWIASLQPADEADLRGQSVERVTRFVESFPPLDRRSNPMVEATTSWPLDGPIVLRARADLTIGRPAGAESRKVIVDFKTGRPSPRHRLDLGFYGLLETVARHLPPRRLATFYLDVGEAHVEDVTEESLRSALRRTLDGMNAIVELEIEQRPPVKRPGAACGWCPLLERCAEGRTYLDGADDVD